jgi:hypothetical protein
VSTIHQVSSPIQYQYQCGIATVQTKGIVFVWYHDSTDSGDFKKTVDADDVSDVY